jgi:hypothetical protein
MTVLTRFTKLGGAKEATSYTYLAPTFSMPFNTGNGLQLITVRRCVRPRLRQTGVSAARPAPALLTL